MQRLVILLAALAVVRSQTATSCPQDWVEFGTKCYRFVGYPRLSYLQAIQKCQEVDSVLVTVNDASENTFITNWLQTNDARREPWYTSGIVDKTQATGIRWSEQLDITVLDGAWLNLADKNRDGMNVAYTYSGSRYGWAAVPLADVLSYICEIDRADAYKIAREERDFEYGMEFSDPNNVPRGPYFLEQPRDMMILGTTTSAYLDCVALGMPAPTYRWYKITSNQTVEITTDMDKRFTLTNGRLSIANPTSSQDTGTYQCLATNVYGAIMSRQLQFSFGTLGEFSNVQTAPVRAEEFQGAQMSCPGITARPAARYQWFKNSAANFIRPELNQYTYISNNGKLYFSETQRADDAMYYCVVSLFATGTSSNYVGSSQTPSRVSVGFKLNVVAQAGGYYHPQIVDDFISVYPGTPKRGTTITLECFAYGTGPLRYSWRRYGREMPKNMRLEDSNRKLIIEDVGLEDEGIYGCRVDNPKEGTDKNYTLKIEADPYFTYPLRDQHRDIGSSLTWHCEAAGSPLPTYYWLKNGQRLETIPGVVTVSGNTLRFTSLEKTRDSGMYQCVATNRHGVSYSTGQLRVLEFKPSFTKHHMDKSIAATIAGNATLACDPEAAPFPIYTWRKDGRDLGISMGAISGNVQLLINGHLHIMGVRQSDRGTYTCRVENNLGNAEDSSFLEVYEATRITQRPIAQRVLVNSSATLTCIASYNPSVDMVYSWTFNNHLIYPERDPHYRISVGQRSEGSLYILNAQFDHQGMYKCRAFTSMDSDEAEAFVTVEGPPGEPGGVFRDINARSLADRDVRLLWSDGMRNGADILYYDIEFQTNFNLNWRNLVSKIPAASTIDQLFPDKRYAVLQGLKPGASYKFRVSASNVYGSGPFSLPTTEIKIPGDRPYTAPAHVSGGGGKVGDLTITWQPLSPEDHNGDQVGYIVHWRAKPTQGADSRWNIHELKGADHNHYVTLVGVDNYYKPYEARVQAFNEYGAGNLSAIAEIFSAEALPTATPRNVYAMPYNSTALMVTWTPVVNDRDNVKGVLEGYKINYWLQNVELETQAKQQILRGQRDRGLIIGLMPETFYQVNVQVYNGAGNGPKSEDYEQSTDNAAASLYPTEVHVYSHDSESVRVQFRGVSTKPKEEPLQGYKIQYWRTGENIRNALHVDVGKDDSGIVPNVEKGIVYQLRVFAYSRAGQGKMSNPPVYFTLGGQLRYDPDTTEVLAGAGAMGSSLLLLLLSAALTLWVCRT